MREGAEGFLGSAPGGPHSALIVRDLTRPSSFAALYPKDVSLLGNFLALCAASAGGVGLIPGLNDPLEEEMATHSSTPMDRGGWQAMGLQRVMTE